MRPSLTPLILAFFTVSSLWSQEPTGTELIARAIMNPNNESAVWEAIAYLNAPAGVVLDASVFPAYKELFGKMTERRQLQALAVALLKHGQKDDVYFETLAKYAGEAILADPPPPGEFDEKGNEITDQLSPRFVKWCEVKHLQRNPCLDLTYGFPFDVAELAAANDRRAIPIFRQGLRSLNHGMVAMSVLGLALLNDTDSIPLIATHMQRFPPRLAERIAENIADFDDPRIAPILDRFVRDKNHRLEIDGRRRLHQAGGAAR
jgi:hypothetical protein